MSFASIFPFYKYFPLILFMWSFSEEKLLILMEYSLSIISFIGQYYVWKGNTILKVILVLSSYRSFIDIYFTIFIMEVIKHSNYMMNPYVDFASYQHFAYFVSLILSSFCFYFVLEYFKAKTYDIPWINSSF